MNKLLLILLIIIFPDLSSAYELDQGEAGIPLIAPGKTNLPEPIGMLLGFIIILFFLYYFISGIREMIREDPAVIITFAIGFLVLFTFGLDMIDLMRKNLVVISG